MNSAITVTKCKRPRTTKVVTSPYSFLIMNKQSVVDIVKTTLLYRGGKHKTQHELKEKYGVNQSIFWLIELTEYCR